MWKRIGQVLFQDFLPRATERKDLWFRMRRDWRRAGLGEKQEFGFRNFKFEILIVCFEEEIFYSRYEYWWELSRIEKKNWFQRNVK